MCLKGAFSYFPTRKLTADEVENCDNYVTVCITPNAREWDPNNEAWGEEEDKYLDENGELVHLPSPKRRKLVHKGDFQIDDSEGWTSINVSASKWEGAMDKFLELDNMECMPVGPDLS